MMTKKFDWRIWLSCGFIGVISGGIILLLLLFITPSNNRDNHNPAKQAEMMQLTLEWGRLAPFPTNAENVTIRTEDNRFTRSFRAQFNAPDEDIGNWIEVSPGLKEAKMEEMTDGKVKYIIAPGGGANYAEVIVDFRSDEVEVYVSWS